MPTRVKFCGCMNWADVSLAIDEGADAAGMIFSASDRRIDWNAAAEIASRIGSQIVPVGVFVDPAIEEVERARWYFPELVLQFSGSETPEFVREAGGEVIKAIHVHPEESAAQLEARCAAYAPAMSLFDTHVTGYFGGTGVTFDWTKVARIAREREIVVAGGLTAENVGACIRAVRPAWVDVRSGIETNGRKDAEKMQRFIAAVRAADAG
jgi:phosphoribosylanthranilate isomerase